MSQKETLLRPQFVIRRCTPSDVERVLDLWRLATTIGPTDNADALNIAITSPSTVVLVGEVYGEIIGSIIGGFDGWRGNVYRLAVHPEYRRRGYARMLVDELGKWFSEKGVKRITALVEKEHPWAVAFWSAVGYQDDQRMARFVLNL